MLVILEIFWELFMDRDMKDHVKSARSLQKIIANYPSTTSSKFSSLKLSNLKSIVNLQ
jgi:hypothetical protein